jgi:hypothetical protein
MQGVAKLSNKSIREKTGKYQGRQCYEYHPAFDVLDPKGAHSWT